MFYIHTWMTTGDTIILDGLEAVGSRVRCDLLENLAALHYLDVTSVPLALRWVPQHIA